MRVLVTGGAGYIGSVIVEALLQAGHSTVVFDSLVRGHVEAIHPQAKFVCGMIQDRPHLAQTLQEHQIEAVIHMAAFIEAGESVKQPDVFFQNNVVGALQVVRAMIEVGVKKLVFSSTAALYGDPEHLPIAEEDVVAPTNPYGESKRVTEQMLRWMAPTYGITATALRYFNAAGASEHYGEDHSPETHLIPLVLRAALNSTPIAIFGTDYPTPDGTCVRDYVHVLDLAQAHLLALGRTEPGLRIYNAGNGSGYSVREVIHAVERVAGRPLQVIERERRTGDQIATVASSEKIRRELGWQPRFGAIDDIVRSAWNWRVAHPEGYHR